MGVIDNPAKRKDDMVDIELTHVLRLSEHAVQFRARVLHEAPFTFHPGQWVYLIDAQGFREDKRAFSLGSVPGAAELEFGIEIVPGGLFSPRVRDWQVGDRFTLRGPYGTFMLRAEETQPLLLLGFNSGIVPLVSMLKTQLIRQPDATLFIAYALTDTDHALFEADLREIGGDSETVHYFPTFTGTRDPAQFSDTTRAGLAGFIELFATTHPAGWVYTAGIGHWITLVNTLLDAARIPAPQRFEERYD